MKKTKYRLYLLLIIALLGCVSVGAAYLVANSSVSEDANLSTMKDLMTSKYGSFKFGSWCSYDVFDYKGLSREASTIALVTSKDTLSDSMSNGIGTGGGLEGDIYYNTFSLRTVDVIEYYRNNKQYGDTFRISEPCIMLEDSTVIAEDQWYPLQEGDTYLVFLYVCGNGYPSSICGDNGTFDLTYLRLNNRLPVVIEALYDLDLLVYNEKSDDVIQALNSSNIVTSKYKEATEKIYNEAVWDSIELTTEYTKDDLMIVLEYTKTDSGYLFKLGSSFYESK